MKSFSFFLSLIIISIIGYGAYFFYNQTYEQTMIELQNNPPLSAIPSVNPSMLEASESATASAIPTEWKMYTSSKYGYSIRHPKNMQNDTTSEGDRFYWLGPTQSLGTELYDGISLIIKSGRRENKPLKEIAEERHTLMKKEETTKSITTVKQAKFGKIEGYQFRKESLGDGDYIYIPISNQDYIEVINMTVQPEDAPGEKYQDIVNLMLSSIY